MGESARPDLATASAKRSRRFQVGITAATLAAAAVGMLHQNNLWQGAHIARRAYRRRERMMELMKHFLLAAAALAMSRVSPPPALATSKRFICCRCPTGWINIWRSNSLPGAVLQVVTDPQKADAILTDHLGESFEQSLDDLYAPKPKADDKSATKRRITGDLCPLRHAGTNAAAAPFSWSTAELTRYCGASTSFPKTKRPDGMRHYSRQDQR